MLKSSLCNYTDGNILVKITITIANTAASAAAANNTNKKAIFTSCTPFANYISEINNIQIDNAKGINVVMPMSDMIEYCDNYLKTSESL